MPETPPLESQTTEEEMSLADHPRHRRKAGWREWVQWIVASAFGSGLGMGAAWEVGLALYGGVYSELGGGIRITLDPSGALLFYAISGGILGVSQWLVLRRHLAGAGWWVGAVLVAGILFAVFSLIVDGGTTGPAAAVPGAVILGTFGGIVTGGPLVWWLRSRSGIRNLR